MRPLDEPNAGNLAWPVAERKPLDAACLSGLPTVLRRRPTPV
jgi:hypothetical protein